MSRRNSIQKRLIQHRAAVAAEQARDAMRKTLKLRRHVKEEAGKLAGELKRVVRVDPNDTTSVAGQDPTERPEELPKLNSVPMAVEGMKSGKIRKRNAERKKAEVRRKKMEMRMRERMEMDVDMWEEDEVRPMPKLALVKLTDASKTVRVDGAPVGDVSCGIQNGSDRASVPWSLMKKLQTIRKKSSSKIRRDERKDKLQILMRESIVASDPINNSS